MIRLMRYLGALGAAALIAVAGPAATADQIAVVELFTSQGCALCPPVDRMVGEMARADRVLVLSFHVDYWNYIGWKDPFSSREATARQKAYGKALKKKGYVYTPQIIIDGTIELGGGEQGRVAAQIRAAQQRPKLDITLVRTGDGLAVVHIPAGDLAGPPADIWVAVYDRRTETKVHAGENAGKTLSSTNVVRAFQRIGKWHGAELTLTLPLAALGSNGRDACAVIVQRQGPGPILGAKDILLAGRPH